jgi:inosine-uridine nucleoside N-ribohydrolase
VPRKMILDCDTGTDDAVAVMLAALHPEIELVACTTVNGNVEVEHCTDNTLRTLDFIGCPQIPVYEGATRPIVRPDFPLPRSAQNKGQIHSTELPLPAATSRKQEVGAVEFLIETYRKALDEIVLVPVGPLTNIAAALIAEPRFVELVPEVVIMGGAHGPGNITPAAEFNMWADPEAAAIVFAAGFRKITMVPLDATHKALVTSKQCAALDALQTPAGIAAGRFIGQRIKGYDATQPMAVPGSCPVHDAVCVNFLVDPSVISVRHTHVAVETSGDLTLGKTVVDVNNRHRLPRNCDVALDADADLFNRTLYETFSRAVRA